MKLLTTVKRDITNFIKIICTSKKVDNAEKKLIIIAISTGLASASNGSVKLSDNQLEDISDAIVQGLNKLSSKLIKRIDK